VAARPKPGRAKRYYRASKSLAASYIFIAPLLALYQLGITYDPGARSGADFLFADLFDRVGRFGFLFLNLVLLGFLFLAIWRSKAKRIHVRGLYWSMLLEAVAGACLLLVVAFLVPPSAFPERLALPAFGQRLVASLGAGIYEETIFRLVLLGGSVFVIGRLLGGHPAWVVPLCIGMSAALFSIAHHYYGGEVYQPRVFYFRTMMGALLGTLYWFRGLGIVVYVHALYNVAIVVSRNV